MHLKHPLTRRKQNIIPKRRIKLAIHEPKSTHTGYHQKIQQIDYLGILVREVIVVIHLNSQGKN